MAIKGGESIMYESSYIICVGKHVEPKIRNEHTDGKFVTYPEYYRIIRRKKLKEIYEENN